MDVRNWIWWLCTLLLGFPSVSRGASEVGSSVDASPCPVRLLSVGNSNDALEDDGSNFVLEEGGVKYLEMQRGPLYVVPMLGVYRGGKSFLLNRCRGLTAPYVSGFGVGHSQATQTRGIEVCAEWIDGVGTVVWMDTEGLFSSEMSKSTYGAKMFSLALLFSSTVLVNSVKIFSDQFFTYFGEQQRVARALRHGLEAEGLAEDSLLPRNLSVTWILQQPVGYDTSQLQVESQLTSFLSGGWRLGAAGELRERVRQEYNHHVHVVPAGSDDSRQWEILNQLPEAHLSHDYVASTAQLRQKVLGLLSSARPFHPTSIVPQLRMYTELVGAGKLSGQMARDAFEKAELGSRCAAFAAQVALIAGPLPSMNLASSLVLARVETETQAALAADVLHLGTSWLERLDRCLDDSAAAMVKDNEGKVFEIWWENAQTTSEGADCFFLDSLMAMRAEVEATYAQKLGAHWRSESSRLAVELQKVRLQECLKLKHVLLPIAPWIAFPIVAAYVDSGVLSGLLRLLVHVVLAVGACAILRNCGQLPSFVDVEYPVLRSTPHLLDTALLIMPWMPWPKVAMSACVIGLFRRIIQLGKLIHERSRPAGDQVGGLVNLELKLNVLLRRSGAALQQQLLASFQESDIFVRCRDERSAALALLSGLCIFRDVSAEDQLAGQVGPVLRGRIGRLLERGIREDESAEGLIQAWRGRDPLGCALQGNFGAAALAGVEILEACITKEAPKRRSRAMSPGPTACGGG